MYPRGIKTFPSYQSICAYDDSDEKCIETILRTMKYANSGMYDLKVFQNVIKSFIKTHPEKLEYNEKDYDPLVWSSEKNIKFEYDGNEWRGTIVKEKYRNKGEGGKVYQNHHVMLVGCGVLEGNKIHKMEKSEMIDTASIFLNYFDSKTFEVECARLSEGHGIFIRIKSGIYDTYFGFTVLFTHVIQESLYENLYNIIKGYIPSFLKYT